VKRLWRFVWRLAARSLAVLAARAQLRHCQAGWRVATTGRVNVRAEGVIAIAERTTICGGLRPTVLVAHKGARLEIGAGCMINAGSRYEAFQEVCIGRRCLIASAVEISDRYEDRLGAIAIEDDVWLAHGVRVRPGVRIGKGSVVSAGSVVTTDVPPNSLAVGNPARAVPLGLVASP
jgi:acetyltransferase-like isoleucine patch superfamily enzyme